MSVEQWVPLVLSAVGLSGIAALITALATRKQNVRTSENNRFESTSELAQYMRDEIQKEVDRQLGPIRTELSTVKAESKELHDVIRSREFELWRWDQAGRSGALPLLPRKVRDALGISGLFNPLNNEGTNA